MANVERLEEYIATHSERFTEDLLDLVSQPSVSATNQGVDRCTDLLVSLCEAAGFDDTGIVESGGQPSIIARAFADHDPTNDEPTVLMYGHYDVQPVDPDKWTTPPFESDIRDGPTGGPHIFGRGVSDMKAQLFAHICAVDVYRNTGGLPLNVTLFLEGEEEIGSPTIERTIAEHKSLLEADVLYHPDGEMWVDEQPHLLLGDRGLVLGQIDVTAADRDLHSGHFGGPVPNAAWMLIQLCESMIDEDGSIAIAGVYDDVRDLTETDYETLEALSFDENAIKDRFGLTDFAPGKGNSYPERIMYYPQLNFSGFTAGYGGEGNKNIVPSKAQVKFDVRLVPNQDPDRIFENIAQHVDEHSSGLVDTSITRLDAGGRKNEASETPLESPYLGPIRDAVEHVWGVEPNIFQRSGASGPIDVFERQLHVPHFNVPYGSSGSRRHGPDENMAVSYFTNGIRTSVHVLNNLSEDV